MRYEYLQVTDEMMGVRAPALAKLLSARGRRVSTGDALLLLLRLDAWVVRQVDEHAPDLAAEVRAAATLPAARACELLELAVDWPDGKGDALLAVLVDPAVRALEAVEGGWRVRGASERYRGLAESKRDARGRSAASRRAKAAGWVPGDGRTWVHTTTGEVLPSWREVLARLEPQDTPGGGVHPIRPKRARAAQGGEP